MNYLRVFYPTPSSFPLVFISKNQYPKYLFNLPENTSRFL